MTKVSKYKILIIILGIIIIVLLIFYYSLSPVKRNIAKQKILHTTHLLNPDWSKSIIKSNDGGYVANFTSSTLLVDGIYPSMLGPTAYKTFLLDDREDEIYWITGLEVGANTNQKTQNKSSDFICHVNLYHSEVEHYARMQMEDRINNDQAPQLITLTKGDLDFSFPEGFGFPIFSNEKILLGGQVLNLNHKNPLFTINYDFKIKFEKNKEKRLKPLYTRYAVLALPYDLTDEIDYDNQITNDKVRCVILEGEHHGLNSKNKQGQPITAFWKVPPGKHIYRSNITSFLALDTIVTLHKINSHVHPFANSLALRDITIDSTLFKSVVTNYKDKIGLDKITSFASQKGIKLYPNHLYELVEEVDNTTDSEIEMMGSMFLYFYDYKLDRILDSIN